jgi:transposase
MKKYLLIIGIDVSKLTLAVCYKFDSEFIQFETSNDAKGISRIIGLRDKYKLQDEDILICCENTGSYMDKLAYAIRSTRITLWVVHPMIIKSYKLELDRIKTDTVDARKIVEFAYAHQHKVVHYHHPDNKSRMLRDLFRLRKQIIKLRQQVLNFQDSHQTRAISHPVNDLVYNQIKEILTQFIVAIEKEIKDLFMKDKTYHDYMHELCSIPGIGPVISQHMIIITDGFKRFNDHKKFACHIGIAPFSRTSGTSLRYRPRTSKKADQKFKAHLHQGAISAIRPGQLFHQYYHAMIEKGKHHLWIINSIMNMIIKLAFRMIKSMQLFDKNLYLKNKKSWATNLELS